MVHVVTLPAWVAHAALVALTVGAGGLAAAIVATARDHPTTTRNAVTRDTHEGDT